MKSSEALEIIWEKLKEYEVPHSDAVKLAMGTLENIYGDNDKRHAVKSNSTDWLCTIPYKFMKDGYVWSLLSVKNDFSKPESETFVHGEYENQYGHVKQFTLKEFRV